jgi:hypothetical protein
MPMETNEKNNRLTGRASRYDCVKPVVYISKRAIKTTMERSKQPAVRIDSGNESQESSPYDK